jgi:hypothetical protein
MSSVVFDHLVYGVPDLLAGVEEFARATGVRPVVGGRHVGFGTANYLVGLGQGRYLELIGIDPEAPDSASRRMFAIRPGEPAKLLTWAVRTDDIDATVTAARVKGYDAGLPSQLSRRTATGELLEWQLTPDTLETTGGLVPFLIDWGGTRHPTQNDLPLVELSSFTLASPNRDELVASLTALGVTADVMTSDRASLRAELRTPNGPVSLE